MRLGISESNYIIISPVKDEQAYVRRTIESVISQTLRPTIWLIVDDGSSDETPHIINEYSSKYPWIKILTLNRRGVRKIPAEIRAFNEGYKLVEDEAFDFIIKLDCDLSFNPDYFERLLERFNRDKLLGIASGVYLEQKRNAWVPVKMPDYHTTGASKVVRAKCFKDIGGFVNERGWDTLDEIRAQMKGWKTCHFPDLEMYHLKNEGSGLGYLSVNAMHGEIYYLVGGSKPFFCLKAVHRVMTGRPLFLGGFSMAYGYLKAYLCRRDLVVTKEEADFYRKTLNKRIKDKMTTLIPIKPIKAAGKKILPGKG